MKNPFRHLTVVTLVWLLGIAAGAVLLFTIGPQLQGAVDSHLVPAANRWWYAPLWLVVSFGPGAVATVLWLRSDDPAV